MPFTSNFFLLLTALMLCWSTGLVYCDDFPNHGVLSDAGKADVQFFFSPYNSMGAYFDVITNAKHTLDIYIPTIGSSKGKSCHTKGCKVIASNGRPVEYKEQFPIFRALLYAVNKNKDIKIRILTDGSSTKYFRKDKVTPAQFLYIAFAQTALRPDQELTVVGPGNIDIRLLRTAYHKKHNPSFFNPRTIFQHAKVIIADYGDTESEATLISAVNWSHGGLFENADQGVVVQKNKAVAGLVQNSFEIDWEQAKQDYICECEYPAFGKDAIKSIQDQSATLALNYKDDSWWAPAWGMHFASHLHLSTNIKVVFAHPDGLLFDNDEQNSHGYAELQKSLHFAKNKVEVMMYDMENDNICKLLLRMAQEKQDVDYILRVSHRVVAKKVSRNPCYKMLTEKGLPNLMIYYQDGKQKGPDDENIQFEHEKFWIVDEKYVMMSTGNWKSKDLPDKNLSQSCYRGFTIGFEDENVVKIFKEVIKAIGGGRNLWVYETDSKSTSDSPKPLMFKK